MAKGKNTCKILKEIRKQIAEDNDIELITSECTYQGDCEGTCPKCESEVRYLERELEKRQRLGKAAVFAGMSIGTLFAATSCGSTTQATSGPDANPTSSTETRCPDSIPEIPRPLGGDVVAVMPPEPEPKPDPDTVITEPLMGLVAFYHNRFDFDAEAYQKTLKDLFVFPETEHLSIISGAVYYEHVADDALCTSLEQLAEASVEFRAPHYYGGEQKMLEALSAALKDANVAAERFSGDMEVEMDVVESGELREVKVVKGIDVTLDAAVAAALEQMRWVPGTYEMKDGMSFPLDCHCLQKIHFPIK